MTENPYAPPKAAVSEVAENVPSVRPKEVTRAVWVLWLAYGLGLFSSLSNLFTITRAQVPVNTRRLLIQQVVMFLLYLWVYWKISKGRNWARILQLVFFIMGAFGLALMIAARSDLAIKVLRDNLWMSIIGIIMNLYALWLLFISPGKGWFRKRVG